MAEEIRAGEDNESNKLRVELEQYLQESRIRLTACDDSGEKGTTGGPLVYFPADFDAISNAMTREDLETAGKEDWSNFERDVGADFEEGRYRSLFSSAGTEAELEGGRRESREAARINGGMARIAMLDRQLRAIGRRAREAAAASAGEDDAGDATFLTRAGPRAAWKLAALEDQAQAQRALDGDEGLDSSVVGATRMPQTSDDARLAALLSEADGRDPDGTGTGTFMGMLLSSGDRLRLEKIDHRLSSFHPHNDLQPTPSAGSAVREHSSSEAALVRLQRVRLEYARTLDAALYRTTRGEAGTGSFVPYLRPILLEQEDFRVLAQSDVEGSEVGESEGTEEWDSRPLAFEFALERLRSNKPVTRAEIDHLIARYSSEASLKELGGSEGAKGGVELDVLLSNMRHQVELLTSLRSQQSQQLRQMQS